MRAVLSTIHPRWQTPNMWEEERMDIETHARARSTRAPQASVTGTQSVRRAVEILRQVATYGRTGVRLVDVTAALKLQRSTAHRILQCLADEGLIVQKIPGQRYVLGPLAFELGLGAALREELREICRPALERIAGESGDVAFLSGTKRTRNGMYRLRGGHVPGQGLYAPGRRSAAAGFRRRGRVHAGGHAGRGSA